MRLGQHRRMNFSNFLRPMRGGLIAASILGLSGVAAAVDSAATAAAESKARIDALIGDAACDSQSQCRTVAVGARPCGGPEGWLAWSTKGTDAQALQDAAHAHAQAREEENRRSGLASDCRVLPEPTVVCRPRAGDGKKTCQLGQGGVDSAI